MEQLDKTFKCVISTHIICFRLRVDFAYTLQNQSMLPLHTQLDKEGRNNSFLLSLLTYPDKVDIIQTCYYYQDVKGAENATYRLLA